VSGVAALMGVAVVYFTRSTRSAGPPLAPHAALPDTGLAGVENGIHLPTGLKAEPGFGIVAAHCLRCHSSRLVIQNRASRQGWEQLIRWMQATQGLPDLGIAEPVILDYLAAHYAPVASGRRPPLTGISWYQLEE
jgi:hypothetical protein